MASTVELKVIDTREMYVYYSHYISLNRIMIKARKYCVEGEIIGKTTLSKQCQYA